jgi:hypothetical protein
MNTTRHVFSVTSRTYKNAPRDICYGRHCQSMRGNSALRHGFQELYVISNRSYSSRARRVKALATGKTTPKNNLKPATQRHLLERLTKENDVPSVALTKDSNAATPKTNTPIPNAVSTSHKDTAVGLKGPGQRYGMQDFSTANHKVLTINSIPRKTPHLERWCIQERLHRHHQHRSSCFHGLGFCILGSKVYNATRAGWVVCFTRYVFVYP